MRPLLASVLVFIAFAGCVQGAPAADTIPTAPELGFGSVYGTVLDDELRPLGAATVTLIEAAEAQATGIDGAFSFDRVLEGDYTLAITAAEFESVTRLVTVFHDLDVRVDANLAKLPEFRAHNETLLLKGRYDCAAEYLIITGHCGILWERVTCDAGSCRPDPLFSQAYQFRFNVSNRWDTIVSELTWTSAASNALDGMRMYIENTNITEQAGHSTKVARIDGNVQPLRLRVDRGTVHDDADFYNGTTTRAFIPDEGGLEQLRVFPKGNLYDDATSNACAPSFGCFLGVGAGVNVDFVAYVTMFYNEAAPADFTAVPPPT